MRVVRPSALGERDDVQRLVRCGRRRRIGHLVDLGGDDPLVRDDLSGVVHALYTARI
jgi:hypothetical protein